MNSGGVIKMYLVLWWDKKVQRWIVFSNKKKVSGYSSDITAGKAIVNACKRHRIKYMHDDFKIVSYHNMY